MCYLKSMIFNNKEDTKNSKASAMNVIYKRLVPLNQGKKHQFKAKILQWEKPADKTRNKA